MERKIYSISELNRISRHAVEEQVGRIWVRGEISRLTRHRSGHWYFTLKDENARCAAVMFRGDQRRLAFDPKEGDAVYAEGMATVYEPGGQYQLRVLNMEEAGKGSLQEAFEKLKKKLAEEGLFESDRKKQLPLLPKTIGLVTSPTGAAIRDILQVLDRRFPNAHILLAPARVQGKTAAAEISAAIEKQNRFGLADVLIVSRGGGSLEDLWAFNEEPVARAIAASRIPVISGVGHEIDFTIADFVADVRAPTPSAAAELVVGRREEFEDRLRQYRRQLTASLRTRLLEMQQRLTRAERSYAFREPGFLLRQHHQHLDHIHTRMRRALLEQLHRRQQQVDELSNQPLREITALLHNRQQQLTRFESALQALNPGRVLERGYSITRLADGSVLRSASDAAVTQVIETLLKDGKLISTVTDQEI